MATFSDSSSRPSIFPSGVDRDQVHPLLPGEAVLFHEMPDVVAVAAVLRQQVNDEVEVQVFGIGDEVELPMA